MLLHFRPSLPSETAPGMPLRNLATTSGLSFDCRGQGCSEGRSKVWIAIPKAIWYPLVQLRSPPRGQTYARFSDHSADVTLPLSCTSLRLAPHPPPPISPLPYLLPPRPPKIIKTLSLKSSTRSPAKSSQVPIKITKQLVQAPHARAARRVNHQITHLLMSHRLLLIRSLLP